MRLRIITALFLISLTLWAGCAVSEPSRFYTLTPIQDSEIGTRAEKYERKIAIGVGPVRFPDYLDRKQIVTRSGRNEIKISEFDRWAGQLKDNTISILCENLSALLSTNLVFAYPWPGSTKPDYVVEVEIMQFDGDLGGKVVLVSRWIVRGGRDKKVLYMKKSRYVEPVEAQGYPAMVAAESRALANLSRDIGSMIGILSQASAPSGPA